MTQHALAIIDLVVDHRINARRSVRAVDHVDLHVRAGEVHALVGESGSGKTSLARAALRLIPRTSGSLWVDGSDFGRARGRHLRALRTRMQYVAQDPLDALDPRVTVQQSVAEPWLVHRVPHDPVRDVARLLAQVGLDATLATRLPHQLSGGQRQRVCVARALALEPAVVVLDEPFAALDPPVAAQVLDTIDELRTRRDTAFLLVTHDLAMVESVADTVSVMADGEIVEHGPTTAVFTSPRAAATMRLLDARIPHDPERARQWRPCSVSATTTSQES